MAWIKDDYDRASHRERRTIARVVQCGIIPRKSLFYDSLLSDEEEKGERKEDQTVLGGEGGFNADCQLKEVWKKGLRVNQSLSYVE